MSGGFDSERMNTPYLPGLSFFRNRVYDENTGRWTQEDPLGVAGDINLYRFSGNNPQQYSDPFGLQICTWCMTAAFGGSSGSSSPSASKQIAYTLLGAVAGFIGGGGEGAVVSLACGPAAEICAVVTIPAGALKGAVVGAGIGLSVAQMGNAGKGRGSNTNDNDLVRRIGKDNNLNADGREALHLAISKEGYTEQEIREIAEELAKQQKYVNPPPPQ